MPKQPQRAFIEINERIGMEDAPAHGLVIGSLMWHIPKRSDKKSWLWGLISSERTVYEPVPTTIEHLLGLGLIEESTHERYFSQHPQYAAMASRLPRSRQPLYVVTTKGNYQVGLALADQF